MILRTGTFERLLTCSRVNPTFSRAFLRLMPMTLRKCPGGSLRDISLQTLSSVVPFSSHASCSTALMDFQTTSSPGYCGFQSFAIRLFLSELEIELFECGSLFRAFTEQPTRFAFEHD